MDKNKLLLVPQVVMDCAESAYKTTRNQFVRDNYILRLEAIRDYCIEVLDKLQTQEIK